MCQWRDIIAGSSTPFSPIQNLFGQNQVEIASTGEQIVIVGRLELLSQSLPSLRYRLSVVYRDLQVDRSRTVMFTGQRFEFNGLQNSCALFIVQLSL